ncbi:hypothetical protein TYRP_009427 [Tyrophagus putrescentiae]|nr:hypothetical protein TYRP_009427 [Tyrophagus putrescentiae]
MVTQASEFNLLACIDVSIASVIISSSDGGGANLFSFSKSGLPKQA